jgi:hypothetical protein
MWSSFQKGMILIIYFLNASGETYQRASEMKNFLFVK